MSSEYAKNSKESPGKLAEQLFGSHHLKIYKPRIQDQIALPSPAEVEWAKRCGKFGDTKPSDLFLRAYHDLLQCLDHDPLANCVGPSLCGGVGYAPRSERSADYDDRDSRFTPSDDNESSMDQAIAAGMPIGLLAVRSCVE